MFLQGIRDRASSWFSWVLLIVVGIPFALWGVNSYFTGRENVSVATVNGDTISAQLFRSVSRQEENRLRQQLGADFQGELLEDPAIRRSLLERMINETLSFQTAKQHRFRIGDAQIAGLIRSNQAFQTEGNFDPDRYAIMLRQQSMEPLTFEQQLRESMIAEQLKTGLAGSDFATPVEVDQFGNIQFQQRDIRYSLIDKARFASEQEIPADEIESYYQENLHQFQTAEMVQVRYLTLRLEDIARDIEVNPEDIRALYEERIQEISEPERRRIRHILVALDKDATEQEERLARDQLALIRKRLGEGENFAELAREFSDDPASANAGGELGLLDKGVLDAELDTLAFSLPVEHVSEPVRSQYGIHLLEVTEIQAGQTPDFASLREELTREIKNQRAQNLFYERAELLQELVFEHPDTLRMAAEQTGLPVQVSDPFSRIGGAGVTALKPFIEQAFSPGVLYQGENSEVFELPGEILVALRLEKHFPSEPRPLAEVRTEIEALLRDEQAREAARDQGEKIQQALANGADSEVLSEYELNWQERKGVTRGGESNLPPFVMEAVFKSKHPGDGNPVYGGRQLPTGDYLLYAVDAVRQPQKSWGETERALVRRDLAKLRGANAYIHYLTEVRATAEVKIYEQNL